MLDTDTYEPFKTCLPWPSTGNITVINWPPQWFATPRIEVMHANTATCGWAIRASQPFPAKPPRLVGDPRRSGCCASCVQGVVNTLSRKVWQHPVSVSWPAASCVTFAHHNVKALSEMAHNTNHGRKNHMVLIKHDVGSCTSAASHHWLERPGTKPVEPRKLSHAQLDA